MKRGCASAPFFVMRRRHILPICALLLAALVPVFAETDTVSVASPDGQLVLRLFIVSPKDSILVRLAYSLTFHGKVVMNASQIGFTLHDVYVLL